MLGLWLLLYPLFHIHGIPMSQLRHASAIAHRFRVRRSKRSTSRWGCLAEKTRGKSRGHWGQCPISLV